MKRTLLIVLLLWSSKTFSQNKFLEIFGDTSSTTLNKIKQSSDGGSIISGTKISTNSSYFIKTDLAGNLIFCKVFPVSTINDFLETPTGFVLLHSGSSITKLDGSGNPVSTTSFNLPGTAVLISINELDGNYIINGRDSGPLTIKCDTSGNVLWSKKLDSHLSFIFNDFIISDSGKVYSIGQVDSAFTNPRLIVVKSDSSGNQEWNKVFSFHNVNIPIGSINKTTGGIIVCATNRTLVNRYIPTVIDVGPNGIVSWNQAYDDSAHKLIFRDIQPLEDGYIVAGQTYPDNQNQHILLSKIDKLLNVVWAKQYYGAFPNYDIGNSVCKTNDGGYVIAGSTNGFPSNFGVMGFVLKTDSVGELGCYEQTLNLTSSLTSYPENTIHFTQTSLSVSSTTVSSPLFTDEAGTILCSTSTNTSEMEQQIVQLYPNPVSAWLKLRSGNDRCQNRSLSIFNIIGENIFHKILNSSLTEIDCSNFPDGIYFYSIENSEGNISGKFIVAH